MDLIEFLRARLAEEEAAALRATQGPWRYNPRKAWMSPPLALGVLPSAEEYVAAGPLTDPVCVAATGPVDNLESMADAEHIARWDPVRVLAWVAAARAVVDAFQSRDTSDHIIIGAHATGLLLAIRALAVQFAGHPDYEEAWQG